MSDTTNQIAALLHEAGETHHRVFRIVDGADDDWASWYADWLINLSELPELLGRSPVRSELVYMLVRSRQGVHRSRARGALAGLVLSAPVGALLWNGQGISVTLVQSRTLQAPAESDGPPITRIESRFDREW
jgi:hypothetical protein